MFAILVILTSILCLVLLATAFYFGYKLGQKQTKPNNEINKDSLNYLNQFLNMMNYNANTSKGGN